MIKKIRKIERKLSNDFREMLEEFLRIFKNILNMKILNYCTLWKFTKTMTKTMTKLKKKKK